MQSAWLVPRDRPGSSRLCPSAGTEVQLGSFLSGKVPPGTMGGSCIPHCIFWRGTTWTQKGTDICPWHLGAAWRAACGWIWLQAAVSSGLSCLALPS